MSTFLFTKPSERLIGTVIDTVQSTDPDYPISNMDNGRPEMPTKKTAAGPASWMRDLGGAQRCDFVALVHHNLAPGLSVRLLGNSANTWGAPALTATFTIPAPHADGFRPNVWLNLKELFPLAADRTFRYWLLVIDQVNSVGNITIGEWAMYATLYDLGIRNIPWGSERKLHRPAIIQQSELLVRRVYDLGTTIREMYAEPIPDNTNMALVHDWFRDAAGSSLPFMIVPHKGENDAWMVTFTEQTLAHTRSAYNENKTRLTFLELGRGLRI